LLGKNPLVARERVAGRFIVFEGIDSEVLTDQTRCLAGWLRSEGLPVRVTREPTDGPIGAQIRLILDERLKVDELTRAALFLADRLDHLYRAGDGLLYELEQGYYVVCARYLLSAYAYQSEAADFEWLQQINRLCPWPDVMIFVDTPVQSCLDRLVRQAGYDAERLETQSAMLAEQRCQYLHIIERCRQGGQGVTVIDGDQPAETIHRECRGLVERLALEK
jgi:dTMP kinase